MKNTCILFLQILQLLHQLRQRIHHSPTPCIQAYYCPQASRVNERHTVLLHRKASLRIPTLLYDTKTREFHSATTLPVPVLLIVPMMSFLRSRSHQGEHSAFPCHVSRSADLDWCLRLSFMNLKCQMCQICPDKVLRKTSFIWGLSHVFS